MKANPQWVPQLQVNLLHKYPDQGALADVQDTAGNVAYLSPGVTARVCISCTCSGSSSCPFTATFTATRSFRARPSVSGPAMPSERASRLALLSRRTMLQGCAAALAVGRICAAPARRRTRCESARRLRPHRW